MIWTMLRRRGVILGLGLGCLFLAAWFFAWSWIAREVEARARGLLADAVEHGAEVSLGSLALDGFPFRWRLSADRVVIRPPVLPRGDQINLARVEATLWPWAPRSLSLWLPGLHRYERVRPGTITDRWEIVAASPEGRLSVPEDGGSATFEFNLEDVQLWHVDTPDAFRIARLQAAATITDPPDTAAGNAVRVSIDAQRIAFRQPPPVYIATPMPRFTVDVALRGPIGWRLPPGEALANWREGGGTIEILRVLFDASPVVVIGEGTVALDAGDRPIGALTMRVQGYSEAIDALVKAGQMTAREGGGIRAALGLLSRPDGYKGARRAHVPISIQDGRVTAAGFSIARVPTVVFD